jgi:DNA-directed RNA polymerase specialized sigma subunit
METSEEDYRDFNKVIDREKYLTKLDVYFGKISYHAIQNEEGEDVYGEELLEDENINVEETAIESVFTEEMWTRLPKALSTLSDSDRELIHYLFHENLSEREIEKKYFIPRKTVSYRKKRIFATLKKLIE